MNTDKKFGSLLTDNAPGQEIRQNSEDLSSIMIGNKLEGANIDFSHGDIDAFPPSPNADLNWNEGYKIGAAQAYTEYRGLKEIRISLAKRLTSLTNSPVSSQDEIIITPGTQGALFLALGSTVSAGTKVAIVMPDYFANQKLVRFFDGEIIPISLNYNNDSSTKGIDFMLLEEVFRQGVKVFVFSNPNNPTGYVYSEKEINEVALLAAKYDVTVIVDQLYSRMLFSGEEYTHLRSCTTVPKNLITIMGPSKTESLSGFRLGVGFGSPQLIDRMESLQAIVSLRAAGYNQAVLKSWLDEPANWLENRIKQHEAIRNDLLEIFEKAHFSVAKPQAGSYLFPELPPLKYSLKTMVKLVRYQANVIVTPGTEFSPLCTNSIRLNFSQNHTKAVDAAKRIVKMTNLYSI